MNTEDISFIIPVFNRPDEISELLQSFSQLKSAKQFEIVIVEDGSTIASDKVIEEYKEQLSIRYMVKENSGPGDSRNYGMSHAKGQYFIILDSDCILPGNYLENVLESLNKDFVDCFGGPDAAHPSFTNIQKAINFSMTSWLTTGGIRGKKGSIDKFQPRSFNMGLSRKAFEATQGFGRIHPGEDPDLSIRLEKLGFKTKLIPEAYVYHKRRISWSKFYFQVKKFGMVRVILNKWHPQTKKLTYWFPTLFCLGAILAILALFFGFYIPIYGYGIYFLLCLITAMVLTKSIIVTLLSLVAVCIQFFGYGYGFLLANIGLLLSDKNEELLFPNLFFKQKVQ
ncbi:MAG: glycosyltransferase [Flavobacteriaceae bacterium]|nr:glycosyltransferase [Flavobacteriaceae bacterium]